MFLLLYALLAAVNQPAQAALDPHLLCNSLSISPTTDPAYDYVAAADFYHPVFDARTHGYVSVILGGTLPGPFSIWQLVEVNPDPGPNPSTGYVILRNQNSGSLVVLAVENAHGFNIPATRRPAPAKLRPSTRPAPPWPGIGCVYIMPDPLKKGDRRFYAELAGGEYVAEDDLGWFHEGQLLPQPWDDWRVTKIFFAQHPHGPGPFESGVMLHNEKTGQTAEVLLERIGMPSRATTHPSDDLIAAATQPAGAK
jgi:hypothetical protein